MDLRVEVEICVRRRHVLAHVRRRRSVRDVQVRKKGRKTRNPNFFLNLVDIFIDDVYYCTTYALFLYVFEVCVKSTGPPEKVCTWFREISSCSCLTVLPGPAWVLLSKICKDFFSAL